MVPKAIYLQIVSGYIAVFIGYRSLIISCFTDVASGRILSELKKLFPLQDFGTKVKQ
jgi:hypothetical protein